MQGLVNVKSRHSAYGRKSNPRKTNSEDANESDDENFVIDPIDLEELQRQNNELMKAKASEKRKRIRPDFISEDLDEVDQIVPFEGEFGYSMSNKRPILIYRSRRDPTKCFTFQYKRPHGNGGSYSCVQCTKLYQKDRDNNYMLDKIISNGNCFQSDPEKMFHCCIRSGTLQSYVEVMTKQIHR